MFNPQQLMDYEEGKLNREETIELFQNLVDSGLAWQLQGSYGREAARMIMNGSIHTPGQVHSTIH